MSISLNTAAGTEPPRHYTIGLAGSTEPIAGLLDDHGLRWTAQMLEVGEYWIRRDGREVGWITVRPAEPDQAGRTDWWIECDGWSAGPGCTIV